MSKKNNYPDPNAIDTNNVVSSSESTGLFVSPPENSNDVDSIKEIREVPDQCKDK